LRVDPVRVTQRQGMDPKRAQATTPRWRRKRRRP
jgi:hypothetical protein